MKITIKENVQKQEEIKLENLEPGTIVGFGKNYPIGLVVMGMQYTKRELIMLTHSDINHPDLEWFSVAGGWSKHPIKKILGKITEIIVDPNV